MIDKTITHEEARNMVTNNIIEWFRKELLAYITQQKQFAKDVARYFDLDDFKTSLTQQEWEEYKELRKTIQKGVAK